MARNAVAVRALIADEEDCAMWKRHRHLPAGQVDLSGASLKERPGSDSLPGDTRGNFFCLSWVRPWGDGRRQAEDRGGSRVVLTTDVIVAALNGVVAFARRGEQGFAIGDENASAFQLQDSAFLELFDHRAHRGPRRAEEGRQELVGDRQLVL